MTERYSDYTYLEFDYPSERVLRITINKPETRNSLDAVGHSELARVWREVDEDPNIGAVILTGKGKAFSAGGDFSMVETMMNDHNMLAKVNKEARELVYNIINCSKPTVSALNGVAVGAGLAAGLLADIPIAGASAKIIDGHTRIGVAAGDHAVINWPLLCGMAKAKYYLMLCEPMSGEEAERLGLVSLCVPDDELEAKSIEVAEKLAKGAPNALYWTKHTLNNWYRMAGPIFDTGLAYEALGFVGPEMKEGLASIKEKREPDFIGASKK
ncbi:enoyl-CoA hydratase [Roseovarius pacificus]|uniref:Enoyl-CoA hydratase n=1 Tax=Roseovarius pacificus TaxID=337701 RepID=A0A1M7BB64_9RHOB|nr:enoyl-CoA hydratase/isomerase family protein [Roseovarius pacificus]GGO54877.1 enoyl-CoA hydratase [Roseovarius pacificus]SHL52222.1 enoyl-CoA hydratase [Roseovarius pacificus]